ncbi:hypothetical protein [Anthocerotibacter panamensis]|uniref:hypothetical protein n=1 Tax=Anthocerotibacter panamensis TaxID=2857077 RepID=UPI001C4089EA|nr:hypothetical protein [Anthocerotibacter panamensis]
MKQLWWNACVMGLWLCPGVSAQAQAAVTPDQQQQPVVSVDSERSILSLAAANALIQEAQRAAQANDFSLGVDKATQAVTMLNQISAFQESLSKALSGIDNRISEESKQQALTAAIKRDEASYQLAVIHRAQGKPELAVPLLVRVVASQGIDRTLGQAAFQQLYELGFVKTPYGGNVPAAPATPQPRQLEGETSILSMAAANQLLEIAEKASQASDFAMAVDKTSQAVTMLNQISTFHESLAKSLNGIDTRIADEEKRMALTAAVRRDEASYQLAVTHQAQGKPELSVPLLVRIVVSQGVDRDLGKRAFQRLYDIGFVKTAFSAPAAKTP